ncbi:MAG TPA: hypothetical protein VK211_02580 [Kamptonema sp.]|nr:hypothetical protein [Kamptonema sp.]
MVGTRCKKADNSFPEMVVEHSPYYFQPDGLPSRKKLALVKLINLWRDRTESINS